MDRSEFSEKYNEMRALLAEGKKQEALEIVWSINWRKVHNVNALVKASEVCEEAGELDEARNLLYMAHDRSPIGRMVIYHLAMLCVKMGDLEEAKEYYDDFVEIAPHDSMKYIIKYRINKAKGADDTTLIGVLEELKNQDFNEEWAYELAYLYHKTGQVDKCIELCDEIVLWFGDGPYVERALEMKMIYQPLDKVQEDKYRHFQQKRDGITEIRANEILHSGEIVNETIQIPQIELPVERFNTVNLQAEIKKNIDEIMRATEAESVSENMENIKSLVEDIPYLQVNEQKEALALQQTQANMALDANLKDSFREYLEEEYDGQMSLFLPETKEVETQIEGQMTIDDVMAEWEKTRRAAEAALQQAEQEKLVSAKDIALREASQIMDRLEEAIPRLDAGATTTELLREEYMAQENVEPSEITQEMTEVVDDVENVESPERAGDLDQQEALDAKDPAPTLSVQAAGFQIPKIAAGAAVGVGLEIPIVDPKDAHVIKADAAETPVIAKPEHLGDTREWKPPVLEQIQAAVQEQEDTQDEKEATDVDYKEASKIVADVNEMLQQEIDRIIADDVVADTDSAVEAAESMSSEGEEPDITSVISPEDLLVEEDDDDSAEDDNIAVNEQEDNRQNEIDTIEEDAAQNTEQEVPQDEESVEEVSLTDGIISEIPEVSIDPEELADLVDENVLERAISEEIPQMKLSDEEKEIFSYFMPIGGMEKTIVQALTGTRHHLMNRKNSASGNILIQGGVGSGKTMLASNLIKVLQIETGKLTGPVGKIDATQLNKKDVTKVLTKVEEGCLIIEGAGALDEKTQETLRQFLSQETAHVLVLMEGDKKELEKVLTRNTSFAAMFTEKITIPIFTIDELVNFGKVYALEEGYVVDEMAILAMYNRINLIQRLDHPTSLIEVRDIMESAIEKAEKGGLKAIFGRFGAKRYDDEGNLILHEQDFELD